MSSIDLDLARWWGLEDRAARRLATRIADDTGTALVDVGLHEYAGRYGRIALYRRNDDVYALVPGGELAVGCDANRFVPTPAQAADYARSAQRYGLSTDVREYIDEMTSPARTVQLPALLIAVEAVEAGRVKVAADDPRVAALVSQARGEPCSEPPQIEWPGKARIRFSASGEVEAAWLLDVPAFDEEVERLAARGLRLPTPDEWEHACGAGASTLFRWGDDCPVDRYPVDGDGPHRRRNAFGLVIGQDPYQDERTGDPAVVCGGDGGSMVCGGAGFFLGWLTLATAYRDREHAARLADNTADVGMMLVRPVIDL